MTKTVDSFRFVDALTQTVLKSWIARATPGEIPWTPLARPLAECTVAFVSSAGIALNCDTPFDQDLERRNPWWSDPSIRVLPRTTTEAEVGVYHLHIDPRFAKQDLNCVLPLQRLLELEAAGRVGRSAPRHYSFMGYTTQPERLLQESTPGLVRQLHEDAVDVVILVPV